MNIKHLFSENGTDLSIGRISFWITFILLCSFWIKSLLIETPPQVPPSLEYVFYSLLLYNTGKKARSVLVNKNKNELLQENLNG